MKVCFITSEIFVGKRRGGFGKLVRVVGRELVKRGFDVSVICWRGPGEDHVTELDGMEILSYPYDFTTRSPLKHIIDYTNVVPLIRRADADVYISIDCMVETYLAQKVMPDRKHVIWVQDPFDWSDYELLGSIDPNYRISKLKFWVTTKIYERAYKRADLILTQAKCYIPKIAKLYHVNPHRVVYLPNPVEHIPDEDSIRKADEPTVCFLGRMDPQKRYWLFFDLAKEFPEVEFVAIGRPSLLYEKLYERVVKRYQGLKNLKIVGFVSEEKKSEILAKSWVLCLPSIREGLPISFLEALAHKTAILSSVNPDGLTEKFGYWVKNDDFVGSLDFMIKNNKWKIAGEEGYRYVKENHELNSITMRLIQLILA
ncbi:MAG: glycosyltransferase family 4 protein [Desulfurococcaceae archaeon]